MDDFGTKQTKYMRESIKTMEPKEMNKFIAQNKFLLGVNQQKLKK